MVSWQLTGTIKKEKNNTKERKHTKERGKKMNKSDLKIIDELMRMNKTDLKIFKEVVNWINFRLMVLHVYGLVLMFIGMLILFMGLINVSVTNTVLVILLFLLFMNMYSISKWQTRKLELEQRLPNRNMKKK